MLHHSFASLATDVGDNEPTIANLLGHSSHSITTRCVHSADVADDNDEILDEGLSADRSSATECRSTDATRLCES
jgi:integrase